MATTDDNDSQGSSAGAEITSDDIGNEHSQCDAENTTAEDTVAMATSEPNSSPLNFISSRSGSPALVLDGKIEDGTNSQSSQCNEDSNSIANIQSGDEEVESGSEDETAKVQGLTVSGTNADSQGSQSDVNEHVNNEDLKDTEKMVDNEEEDSSGLKIPSDEETGIPTEDETEDKNVPNEDIDKSENSDHEEVSDDEKVDDHEDSSSAEDMEMSPQHQPTVQSPSEDVEKSENTQCNQSTKDETIDENQVRYIVKVTQISDESMSSSHDLTMEQNSAMASEDEEPSSKLDDPSGTSTPQFTTSILNSEDSVDQSSQEQFTQMKENEPTEDKPVESMVSDQSSQSSIADEPPLLMAGGGTECFIKLDEETFKDWNQTRRKMGFENDVEMARFLMRRVSTSSSSKTRPDSQDTIAEKSKTQTKQSSDVPKKKAKSFGGIESIVKRLQQVRTETDDTPTTSQPGSDTEDAIGSELVKIKKEPEETCNTDATSVSISKYASSAIYSSKRIGRKRGRVFVKREPVDFDDYGHDESIGDDTTWPVRIKQEPIDPSEASVQLASAGEKVNPLGDFVMNAASWVSNLVASELEKPQDATSSAPPADSAENLFSDTRLHKIIEAQLSKPDEPSLPEKRLHSLIEEQLKKPIPQMSVTQIKTEPEDTLFIPQSKFEKKEMKKARREARHAKKLKKAHKKEREREIQRYEDLQQQSNSPFERPLSNVSSSSPFENSVNPFVKSTSPFDKSQSPYDERSSSGPEPTSASHCLNSFARMVQIREFTSGNAPGNLTPPAGSPPVPTGLPSHARVPSNQGMSKPVPMKIQTATDRNLPVLTGLLNQPSQAAPVPATAGNPPVPTGLHSHAHVPSSSGLSAGFSSQPQRASPGPTPSGADTPVHLASLFLKSIAQRSSTQEVGESISSAAPPPYQNPAKPWESSPRPADVPSVNQSQSTEPSASKTPLEQLLKVSEAPQQHTSAKSQLESLLKAKDIKDQWSRPSPQLTQQIPHHVTQVHTISSSHILNVPKVTFSGRTINDSSHDSYIKAPAIDRILAATGFSSDSEDSGREEKDLNQDPDWSPPKTKSPRKRSLVRNPNEPEFSLGTSQNAELMIIEPEAKHQKLDTSPAQIANPNPLTNGSGNNTTELTATNTLARLLQMASTKSPANPQTPMKTLQSTPPPPAKTTPKSDYSAKQSAFGAMQAFAQLVEIQGKTPTKSAPNMPPSQPEKLSDSLPSITPTDRSLNSPFHVASPDGSPNSPSSGTVRPAVQTVHDRNGASQKNNYGYSSTKLNGGQNYDLDGPEDLSMHSKIKIKIEPLDRDDSVGDVNPKRDEKHNGGLFTCSLCSRVFSSMTEVTDHKLRIHYSSSYESFEMVN